jgi:hypothetical protein
MLKTFQRVLEHSDDDPVLHTLAKARNEALCFLIQQSANSVHRFVMEKEFYTVEDDVLTYTLHYVQREQLL